MAYTTKYVSNAEFDPTEEAEFQTIHAYREDNGSVKITASTGSDDPENDKFKVVTFNVYTKDWDQKEKKWVDSAKREEYAEKILADNFPDVSSFDELIERAVTDPVTFTGYTDGQSGYFFPYPPRPDKLKIADSKELKKMSGPFRPGPVIENTRFHNFQFTFHVSVNGEEKLYKVSQLTIPSDDPDQMETRLSTKYQTRSLEQLEKDYESVLERDPEAAARVRYAIDRLADRERARVISDLNSALDIDLEDMIANSQTLIFDEIAVELTGDSVWLSGTPILDADAEPEFPEGQ